MSLVTIDCKQPYCGEYEKGIIPYERQVAVDNFVPDPQTCDHCNGSGEEPCCFGCGNPAQVDFLCDLERYQCFDCAIETLKALKEHAEWEAITHEEIGDWTLLKSWDNLWVVMSKFVVDKDPSWIAEDGTLREKGTPYTNERVWRWKTKSQAATALNRYLKKEEGK